MSAKFYEAAIGEKCYRCDTIMNEDCKSVGGAFHCWSCSDFLLRIRDLEKTIQRIRDLHTQGDVYDECKGCDNRCGCWEGDCREWNTWETCPTIKALDGEQE